LEQDSITPTNGWKAYYAATRAIVNINTEFFNIVRDKSLPAMSRFWLNADYVKCIHASGELFSGYEFCFYPFKEYFRFGLAVHIDFILISYIGCCDNFKDCLYDTNGIYIKLPKLHGCLYLS